MKDNGKRLLLTVLPIPAAWYLLAALLHNELLLPMPHVVLVRLVSLALTGDFWLSLGFSGARILGGFMLAFVSGSLLALWSARSETAELVLSPFMRLVKAVPVASFIVLALFWLSSRHLSLFISFLMVLPVVYTNLLQGFHAAKASADKALPEMAQVFSLSPVRKFRYIELPQLRAPLLAGCRVGLGICWKAGVAAEVIGAVKRSLGGNIYNAKVSLEMADLFAWTAVIVLISAGFEHLFLWALEKWLDKGEGRT